MHSFAHPIRHAERTRADHTGVVCGDVRQSYAEIAARCRRLAGALAGLGLSRGDRVAVLAANCHRYLELYQAVPAAGYVVVPLNTRHAEPELRYALEDSETKVLVTDRDPGGLAGAVERVVSLPDEYESLLAGAEEHALGVDVGEDDLAGLFYTGGTTGASKGVMLTHRNLIANTFHWIACSHPSPEDVYLLMAPLFHAAGSNGVLATVWTGGTHVMQPVFEPGPVLEQIAREKISVTLGVPTMLAAMAEEQIARPRDVSTVRMIAHGGSPIATEVVRRTHQAFPGAELIHVYGATETSPLATGLRNEEGLVDGPLARSCGAPLLGVEIAIVDEGGKQLPTGEVGEVAIRGPNVMAGYWNKPEQTAAVLRDGWYRTGDLGYVNETDHLFLVDRAKDMIVSGGENVYCTEVEEVLYKHPAVLEAAVFGVPDEKWGEAVHAVVVPREPVEPKALIEFCRQHVAGYKVPKAIDLQDEPLPKSGPGKVLKRTLRAPYWEGQDRQIS